MIDFNNEKQFTSIATKDNTNIHLFWLAQLFELARI